MEFRRVLFRLAFFLIKTASSTSQSTSDPFFGMTRSSFGPTSDVVALKNMTGSLGISILLSCAWSRKFNPMQMILLGRAIDGPRRTDCATRGADGVWPLSHL